jgi:hypothetical protein
MIYLQTLQTPLKSRIKAEDYSCSLPGTSSCGYNAHGYSNALTNTVDDDDLHGVVREGHSQALKHALMQIRVNIDIRDRVWPSMYHFAQMGPCVRVFGLLTFLEALMCISSGSQTSQTQMRACDSRASSK